NIAKHPDLLIGVVPVINLEWIQKLWRDKSKRGYSTEAVTDTILRRMPDYVNYICPQFMHTHVNFMSRANTIVVPGGKMELAMQLIFTPFIWRMMERKRRAA
ncbi:MAG: phosphoribulokinase, partial [Betaproteobacteria bacterium]|nr:phosphoribulokinase [Betaproteobacteria bacterium]